MPLATQEFRIECAGVVCDQRRLLEINSNRIMVSIDRQDIQRIHSRHGLVAPHPILQLVVGLALATLAYFPIAHLIDWLRHGGVFFDAEALFLAFPVVGLWLAISSFRSGDFLEIQTLKGAKRLVFHGGVDANKINSFIREIQRLYDVPVE